VSHSIPADSIAVEPGQSEPTGPLAGLVVADFSRVLAGPYATQLLADMGATVIKVEGPGGDETRDWAPPEHNGVSTYYLGINRNKRDIVLDLKDPQDQRTAQALAHRADILLENFKPGGLVKFGLDYDTVAAANPGIIYGSITGWGTREGASLPGYDLVVQAASGLMSLTGDPDGPGYRSGMSAFDITTGLQAMIGILAALHHRDVTGRGQHVEVNLLSTALSVMANHSSTFVTTGKVPFRMGNAHPSLFPYEPMPTGDGEIVIVAANNGQFKRLAAAIGRPELPEDPRFTETDDRNRNREALRPLLEAALTQHSATEWFDILSDAGIACGPINTIQGGVELATRLGLEPVVQVGEGDAAVPMIAHPISFSETPASYRTPPPTLGQDTDAVRAWLATDDPKDPA
jgi:crotonobetainyl-CoA:carnitine CoA-transferase CaiB-like acyl-CoA transferase